MTSESYKVLCTINNDFKSHDDNFGKLDVHFELFDKLNVTLVNQGDFFCYTEQIFVTSGFSTLKEKFGSRLFLAECIPNKSIERKEDDCAFVTHSDYCQEMRGLLACEVYNSPLPPVENPIISVEAEPVTRSIVLRDGEALYGPFEYDQALNACNELTLTLKASNSATKVGKKKIIPAFCISKINVSDGQNCIRQFDNDHRQIIGGFKNLMEQPDDQVDFISDDQLISLYGSKLATSPALRGFTKNSVALVRKNFQNVKEFASNLQRFNRLLKTLEKATRWEAHRNELLDELLTKPSGKALLENYIEAHKHRYFESEKKQFEENLKNECTELKEHISCLKQNKDQLESDVRQKRRELDSLETGEARQTRINEEKDKLDEEVTRRRNLIDELDRTISDLTGEYKLKKEVAELKDDIKRLEIEREYIWNKKNKIEQERNRVSGELGKDHDKLVRQLLELKPQVDALYGFNPSSQKTKINFDAVLPTTSSELNTDQKRDAFIEGVQLSLEKNGRKIDYNSVVNILVTLAQSQFTLFSGLPGTGKTSLAKLLGQSMGLGNRLLTIPVARGWTSSRNVLGFYNALSQSFLPASTGLYELLQHLQNESDNAAPAIVLLDEFNLSQPEHYFSPFMEMADPESSRTILTGAPSQPELTIPHYLRFLGTINHDATVQGLSPRMLDRASIIQFDELPQLDAFALGSTASIDHSKSSNPISGTEFIELFSPSALELPEDTRTVLNDATEALREDTVKYGTPVIISFRKIKAIASYCNVASPLISRSAALDYAISQHVLPLLNGYGQTFGERLKALSGVLPEELERSQKMLNNLIEAGTRNMHNYGYNL